MALNQIKYDIAGAAIALLGVCIIIYTLVNSPPNKFRRQSGKAYYLTVNLQPLLLSPKYNLSR